MVSCPLADHGCLVCYTWKWLTVVCVCVLWWVGGGGVTTQELICLSLRGQQEIGLSCPDGRWPLWRQSRFKLLPGPFENTPALLEWLAIWATVPSRRPPLCQACCGRHEWEAWQPPLTPIFQSSCFQYPHSMSKHNTLMYSQSGRPLNTTPFTSLHMCACHPKLTSCVLFAICYHQIIILFLCGDIFRDNMWSQTQSCDHTIN